MSRIFISLSILPALLVMATMSVGWWIGDYNGKYAEVAAKAAERPTDSSDEQVLADLELLKEPQSRFRIHFQLGLATALTVVLINSLSVTYLIGTSRWINEVTDAYGLSDKHADASHELKWNTIPWSVVGACSIMVIVALGAASDPGTLRQTTASWVTWHSTAAMVGASVIVIAIGVQARNIQRNAKVIAEVVDDVRKERIARGLPVEELTEQS